MSCPIKMNTHDENGQMVICMSTEHGHCGGCYKEIDAYAIFCSDECEEMFLAYGKEPGEI